MHNNKTGVSAVWRLMVVPAVVWAVAGAVLVVDVRSEVPIFLGIVAVTVTSLTIHMRTRLPAVDVFEHGYRAGWADREALDGVTYPAPVSNETVVPIRCRSGSRKVRR